MLELQGAAFLRVAAAAVLAVAMQAQAQPARCDAGDRKCEAFRKALDHAVRHLASWREQFRVPLESRIGVGSPELVEYMLLDAIKNDIPDVPRRADPPAGFMSDLHDALAQLPPAVKKLVDSRFAGVYLVDNIGSTGFTEAIRGDIDRPIAAFVVLDPTALGSRTANQWATWRESTPFKRAAGMSLTATIERADSNDRKSAIQYILLHELAHVLSIDNDIHPPWGGAPKAPRSGEYPYYDLSWSVRDGRYVTRFDDSFRDRRNVVYYFGAKIPMDDAAAVYSQLEATDFVSLYAATHPADDFAEAFASYVHTQLMGRPFEIAITRDDRVIKRFVACWGEPRCEKKKRWFDALFPGN